MANRLIPIDASRLDQDEFMLKDPVRFNDAVVSFFQRKYGVYTRQVLKDLRNRSSSRKWLRDLLDWVPWRKVERHFFPLFATASLLGGVTPHHVAFCSAYARAVSLPLLRIDYLIDSAQVESLEETQMHSVCEDLLSNWCCNYDGMMDVPPLPNGQRLFALVLSNYYDVFCSLYEEILSRYDDSLVSQPERALRSILRSSHSQLTCRYFAVAVQASFLISRKKIDPEIMAVAKSFGRIRQLVDQVADVTEDLNMGKLTLPVLFCLVTGDSEYESAILGLWKKARDGRGSSQLTGMLSRIKEKTVSLGGYDKAYTLADMWYRDAIRSTGSYTELRILLRLKRASLERLKINGWTDIANYY